MPHDILLRCYAVLRKRLAQWAEIVDAMPKTRNIAQNLAQCAGCVPVGFGDMVHRLSPNFAVVLLKLKRCKSGQSSNAVAYLAGQWSICDSAFAERLGNFTQIGHLITPYKAPEEPPRLAQGCTKRASSRFRHSGCPARQVKSGYIGSPVRSARIERRLRGLRAAHRLSMPGHQYGLRRSRLI